MTKSDGGNAFPTISASPRDFPDGSDLSRSMGMSLRDYFAAQALVGISMSCGFHWEDIARDAYRAADAMLAEREKP